MKFPLGLIVWLVAVAAGAQTFNPAFLGASKVIPASGGGGADVTENFEGTGYENSWTETFGAPAEDTATTGLSLEASQCLYLTAEAGAEETVVSFTASDSCFVYFLLRVATVPTGAGRTQWQIATSGDVDLLAQAANIGPMQFRMYDGGENQFVNGSFTLSAATTYHVWTEYTKGTGANAVLRIFIATSGTKPGTADCEITNANETAQAAKLKLGCNWTGSAGDIYYDKVRISRTTAFGDNPS